MNEIYSNFLRLIQDPGTIDTLIKSINDIVVDCDSYEYGLPIHNDPRMSQMRECISQWIAKELVGAGDES